MEGVREKRVREALCLKDTGRVDKMREAPRLWGFVAEPRAARKLQEEEKPTGRHPSRGRRASVLMFSGDPTPSQAAAMAEHASNCPMKVVPVSKEPQTFYCAVSTGS